MSEWKDVAISDIAILKNGKKRPSIKGPIPVYGGNGVMDTVDTYNDEDCIAIGRVGAYCGCVYLAKGKVWISDNAISAKANNNADNVYLYYLLGSLNLNRYRIGGAQPLMTQDLIGRIEISLPPLVEQRNIASILSSLDDKIAVNKKICENLEAQAQALFKHWFVDFAPFKDGKFIESELGLIPEGWRVGKLEEMASVVGSGGTPKSSVKEYYVGDILWYGTGEFNDSFIYDSEKHISQEAINNSSAKIFPIHTVLIAMYGATVGKLAILSNEASFNQAALGIVAADNIGFPFIYLTLLACRKQLIRLACGAAQQNLNAGTIKSHLAIIPNDNAMMLFNDLILPIFEKIECLQNESLRLATLRDTLLPKLMSGQIKVNEIEKSL